MNLYLISQDENCDYDTYDSAVVCAPDEATARRVHPRYVSSAVYAIEYAEDLFLQPGNDKFGWPEANTWTESIEDVEVQLIGKALPTMTEVSVIIASFNAG